MIRLHYTVFFTRGILKGLYSREKLKFVNLDSAKSWICGICKNVRRKRLSYKLVAVHIEHITL